MDDTKAAAKSMGYVETVFRPFTPPVMDPKSSWQRPRRAGANATTRPMQAMAADLIKLAMVAVRKGSHAQPGHQMIMQVHFGQNTIELPEGDVDWAGGLPRLMAKLHERCLIGGGGATVG